MLKQNKHTFSIYLQNLESFINGEIFTCSNKDLWFQLFKVLRLKPNEEFVLFDDNKNCLLKLLELSQTKQVLTKQVLTKRVLAKVVSLSINKKFNTSITLACPLLKKDSFEKVAYLATELGVQKLVPILTKKIFKKWDIDKDRIKRIFITAAQQSKNYSIPEIKDPVTLEELLDSFSGEKKIHFDPDGITLVDCLNDLKKIKPSDVLITFGPEADLTSEEKSFLIKSNFEFVALTSTVLRAEHAVSIGIGSIRSVLI